MVVHIRPEPPATADTIVIKLIDHFGECFHDCVFGRRRAGTTPRGHVFDGVEERAGSEGETARAFWVAADGKRAEAGGVCVLRHGVWGVEPLVDGSGKELVKGGLVGTVYVGGIFAWCVNNSGRRSVMAFVV